MFFFIRFGLINFLLTHLSLKFVSVGMWIKIKILSEFAVPNLILNAALLNKDENIHRYIVRG